MSELVINIDDLVGIRYKANGRDRFGYDCYGYAMEVERRFGHTLPEVSPDAKDNKEETAKEVITKAKLFSIEKPTYPGDILMINDSKGVFSHIGVYLGNNMFTHCNFLGVHIDKLSTYEGKIGKVYRWL